MRVRVHGGLPLRGEVALPVDPAVAQRAIAVAALCSHATRIDERTGEVLRSGRVSPGLKLTASTAQRFVRTGEG